MGDGIRICSKCRATMIDEELPKHRCTSTYRLKGDVLWVRWHDSKWYRHELSPTNYNNQRKHPDNSTVPYVEI
jgi:hypothetical protein